MYDIYGAPDFDETITKFDYHTYQPYASSSLNHNDEIRIPIQNQDLYTAPCHSYIYIEGKIERVNKSAAEHATFALVNNAYAFLFEEIRYLLNAVEIDAVRDVGITSTLKGLVSYKMQEKHALDLAGWTYHGESKVSPYHEDVSACIPLKHLLGYAEDFKKIIVNAKQELVLIRSRNDNNLFAGKNGSASFTLTKIEWHVPHVHLADEVKLKLMKNIDTDVYIPYRRWEIHNLPMLRKNNSDTWSVRSSTQLEKPRYVIVAFQTNKRDLITADVTSFDHVNIRNVRLYLGSEVFPYDKQSCDFAKERYTQAYYAYAQFQQSYYGATENSPLISMADYKNKPVFVIDCSKQVETVKTSSVDIRLEFEADKEFPDKTTVYALLLHDTVFKYNPLNGLVQKVSV